MLDLNWALPVALISVIAFLFLMKKILFQPLGDFMEARNKAIEDDLAEARRSYQQAEEALKTYETALAEARQEITEQAMAAQRTMEAQQREIIEQARAEAGQMVSAAQATIARETVEARVRLADAARDLARLLVAKLLGREAMR